MSFKELNITNGEYFNNYIKSKQDGVFISFNEALIQGKPKYPMFTHEFNLERTLTHLHNESKVDEYVSTMDLFINRSEEIKRYQKITLWFGNDTFCLVNLLGVLTFLEQIRYQNKVCLNLIDDESFEVLQKDIEFKLGEFTNCYKVMFNDNEMCLCTNELINKGIKDYFYLQDKNNHLYKYIKKNINKNDMEIILPLLEMTKEYGLSDLILMNMIKECK